MILKADLPKDLEKDILKAYKKLSSQYNTENVDVAVRSSATAEDSSVASWAGELETYLNTSQANLMENIKKPKW